MSTRNGLAAVPPMGWNSYTCYGITVREDEVRRNAAHMARHLAPHGWEYVVIDGMWYQDAGPLAGEAPWEPEFVCRLQDEPHRALYCEPRIEPLPLRLDANGRLWPDLRRFPSSAGEAGFKPLADFIHGLGLKFGLHIMRGIPRQAVARNLPIAGSPHRASDAADTGDICPWWQGMCGMRMDHPAAQAYYDSLLALYAGWGVDYIKADDMGNPRYHHAHVEALSRAIARCGRPVVLSISTGSAGDTSFAEHRKANAELWRIGLDLHDEWPQVRETFEFLPRWMPHSGPGHWPDPDMLPLGRVHIREWEAAKGDPRDTRLTPDEQAAVLTLWCISRSPLMFAGDLPSCDARTLGLITNPEALAVNQRGAHPREAWRLHDARVWRSDAEDGLSRYVACFNVGEAERLAIPLPLSELLLTGPCAVRDLWAREPLGTCTDSFEVEVPPHGARLLKFTPIGSD